MARIVLSTSGSLGDLHPYIAVGRALRARGHQAVIATHGYYRERIESAGLEFHPVRPDLADFGDFATTLARAMDERTGSRYVVERLVLPFVRATYDDLCSACRGADLLVGHVLGFVAPMVSERLGVPRAHTVLQPLAMFSAHDPPIAPAMPGSGFARRLPPAVWKVLWGAGRMWSRSWFRPVDDLRAQLGWSRSNAHPMFDLGRGVPTLALFSPVFAPPQPDWPAGASATGFPIHDRDERGRGMPEQLSRFLDAGPPPLVFTLGSAAVWNPGDFFHAAAAAAARLGQRAVLLVGQEGAPPPGHRDLAVAEYAPHSELFARASVVIHQGGIGTTGQALRSGRPMLVVPFSHDQPDNAARCSRLGVAKVVRRRAATAARMFAALEEILADSKRTAIAASVGDRVRAEDGAATAAVALERSLGQPARAA